MELKGETWSIMWEEKRKGESSRHRGRQRYGRYFKIIFWPCATPFMVMPGLQFHSWGQPGKKPLIARSSFHLPKECQPSLADLCNRLVSQDRALHTQPAATTMVVLLPWEACSLESPDAIPHGLLPNKVLCPGIVRGAAGGESLQHATLNPSGEVQLTGLQWCLLS